MAKNLVRDGNTITYANATGSDIASGSVVVIGAMLGVALVDIADGASGEVAMQGVFDLPKAAAAEIAQGETVIYDVSASEFDDNQAVPAAGDVSGAAVAWEAAGAGAETVRVKLTGPGSVTA